MVDFRQRADHAGCNRRASRTPCGCAPRLRSEIVQTQGTRLNRISLARGRSRFLFRQASKTSHGRVAIADFCAQPRVVFQRRPRSRRSSNEVAPSAGGGGGARDRRSRFVANRRFLAPQAWLACPAAPLFLEATQLKTVCTETVVLRAKSVVTKAQVAGIITLRRNCRRPNVPAAADLP